MSSSSSRRLALIAACLGAILLGAGAWSCRDAIRWNLGPVSVTRTSSFHIRDGVVAFRQITGYERPVTAKDWHTDLEAHPERINPTRPGFPWFGYSDDRQLGIAMHVGADAPNIEDESFLITPANIRVFYFPIWLPAALLFLPLIRRRRPALFGALTKMRTSHA